MQGYIRLTGELLRILSLPAKPTGSKDKGTIELQLVDWLIDALVNIRREERFFIDVAERYSLDIDITDSTGVVPEGKKIMGLQRFEKLFNSLTTGQNNHEFLPWLEGAVLFWATEKVYFTAWSWAKQQVESGTNSDLSKDADGGAMRKEFIPNWTNDEFIKFVETLEGIVNEGIENALSGHEGYREEVIGRAERVWRELLNAEEAFWPEVKVGYVEEGAN